MCGDGTVELGEHCEGTNLDGKTCASFRFASGTLRCANCQYDTSECVVQPPRCGDGIKNQPSEECDIYDLASNTCESLGFIGGSLGCNDSTCKLVKSHCFTNISYCGDYIIQRPNAAGFNEECDGSVPSGASCVQFGYNFGTVTCENCRLNVGSCSDCNNNGFCQPRMDETAENCPGDCLESPLGVSLYINPEAIDVGEGDTVTLDISVSSITNLYSYQFDIEYDPSMLSFISLENGAFLGDNFFCVPTAATLGVLDNIACTKLGDVGGVSGSGLLKKITFKATEPGISKITISDAKLINPRQETISLQVLSGQISVS
jgi:hypothetical protein